MTNKFKIYPPSSKDNKKILMGFKGDTILDAGYAHVPLMTVPTLVFPTKEQIKEETRVPIRIIKAALKQAGYKINRDFSVNIGGIAAIVFVQSISGRRFTTSGQCTVSTMRKGKLSITWTYEPMPGEKSSKNVDISLADPDCFQQIAETIVKAVKENSIRSNVGIMSRYNTDIDPSNYGKITI